MFMLLCILFPYARGWPWDAWFNKGVKRQNHTGSQVYFMLTSTPPRAHRLPRLLALMRKQTRPPDRVILSIPSKYARFSTPFKLPTHHDRLLKVNYLSEDAGPLSKYFGVTQVTEDNTIVIIGDDDVDYGVTFIEDFVASLVSQQGMNTVVTAQFDNTFGRLSPGVMAFAGVGCYAKQLRRLVVRAIQTPVPRPCFLADDVAATHYFKVVRGYELYLVTLRTPNANDHSVWRTNDSIHAFHFDNGKRVNLNCERALLRTRAQPMSAGKMNVYS